MFDLTCSSLLWWTRDFAVGRRQDDRRAGVTSCKVLDKKVFTHGCLRTSVVSSLVFRRKLPISCLVQGTAFSMALLHSFSMYNNLFFPSYLLYKLFIYSFLCYRFLSKWEILRGIQHKSDEIERLLLKLMKRCNVKKKKRILFLPKFSDLNLFESGFFKIWVNDYFFPPKKTSFCCHKKINPTNFKFRSKLEIFFSLE